MMKSVFSLPLEKYTSPAPNVSCFTEIRFKTDPVHSVEVQIAKLRTAAPFQA